MPYSKGEYITYAALIDGREANFRDEDAIHIADFLDRLRESDSIKALCDIFHPVGSCFETTDASFDPNISWGGTWRLEQEGVVHISAGSRFPVGGMGGHESISVPLSGSTGSVVLTDAQIAHGHGFTQPTVNGGSVNIPSSGGHTHIIKAKYARNAIASGSARDQYNADGTLENQNMATINSGTGNHTHTVPNHTHSVSGGAVQNLSGASNTRQAHSHPLSGTLEINLMQPYVAYNRWVRTA